MNKSAIAAAFLITFSAFSVQEMLKNSAEAAFVTRVIDGDTFEIEGGDGVRLLGINTPERGQPLYKNATNFLKNAIEGKNITMMADAARTDKYGRRLRYVFIGGILVNEEILRNGLANIYMLSPSGKYSARLKSAERYAIENNLGLWMTGARKDCVSVAEFNWDAEGNDNSNLNNEYVSFRNNCDSAVNMTGWTLKNSGTKIFKFGRFFLEPIRSVRVRSGCGNNTENELFWCSKKPVWNNDAGFIYLRDSEGLLVLNESYEGANELFK